MKNKNHEKIEPTPQQMNPYLADPRDFQITHGDQYEGNYGEFSGQCGRTKAEYEKLIREGERMANASDFAADGELHPDVNKAGKPKTPGIGGKEGA
jgi:hypothetical protein